MSNSETISLLTILRDETLSNEVHARCTAEIERLGHPPRAPYVVTDEMRRMFAPAVVMTDHELELRRQTLKS
jgi:hypothetical protein